MRYVTETSSLPPSCVVIPGSGQIEVVSCNLDGLVYARKVINKHFALRNRDVRIPFQGPPPTPLPSRSLAMFRATRKRYLVAGSQDQFRLGSPSVVRISHPNRTKPRHGLRRRRNPLGCVGIKSARQQNLGSGPHMVDSSDCMRHRLVSRAGIRSSVGGPHRHQPSALTLINLGTSSHIISS